MATTKIWPIKDNLKRVVDYARNPEKTGYDDLKKTLHYAAQALVVMPKQLTKKCVQSKSGSAN